MASTRLYLIRFHSRGVHLTDFRRSAVYAAVVQAGRMESQRRIETVLVAVVLVGVLRIAFLMRQKEGEIMGCKYATFNSDSGRWNCSVSGDGCMYLAPNSKRCAEDYGEGPDVNMEQNKTNTKEETQ